MKEKKKEKKPIKLQNVSLLHELVYTTQKDNIVIESYNQLFTSLKSLKLNTLRLNVTTIQHSYNIL